MITGRQIRLTVLSILLVITTLLAMLGSQPGVQLARLLAPSLLPGLSIGQTSGDWWRGLILTDVRYQQDNLTIQINQIRLAINYSCLWHQQICFSQLHLNSPTVHLASAEAAADQAAGSATAATGPATTSSRPTDSEDSAQPTNIVSAATSSAANTSVASSWQLKISQLDVEQLQLVLPDSNITLASLQTTLHISLTALPAIELHHSRLLQLHVQLPAPAAATAEQHNPLAALLGSSLPVSFQSTDFNLQQLSVTQSGQAAATPPLRLSHLNWLQVELGTELWQISKLTASLTTPPALQALLLQSLTTQPIPDQSVQAKPGSTAPVTNAVDVPLQLQLDLQRPTAAAAAVTFNAALHHPQFEVSINGTGPLTQWSVDTLLQLSNQAAPSATGSSPSTEPLQLTAQGQLNLLAPQLPFHLAVSAAQLQWQDVRMTSFSADLSGDLSQQRLQLNSQLQTSQLPTVELELQANLDQQQLHWPLLRLQTLNGELLSSGSLQWQQQTLTSHWQINDLQPGLYWPDYPGTIRGSSTLTLQFGKQDGLHIAMPDLVLDGDLRGFPLSMRADWLLAQQPQGWQLQSNTTTLRHGPNQLTASGQIGEQWQLAAQLELVDLSYSLPQVEGSLSGQMAISGDLSNPDIEASLQGQQLSYLDDYALGQLTLSANIKQLGHQASAINLSAQNGQAPGLQLQQLQWQLSGDLQQHHSHLAIDSHQLQLAAAASGALTAGAWQLAVAELRLKSDFGDWQLASPTQLQWLRATKQLRLQPLCLLEQQSALCLRTQQLLSQRQGELALGLGHLSLADLSALLPDNISLAGRLDGEIALRWQTGRLDKLAFDLSSPHGVVRHQLTTAIDLPFSQFKSRGTLSAQTLDAELTTVLAEGSPLAARLTLSKLDSASPQVSANLQVKPLPLKFLQAALTDLQQFNGQLSTELRAEGALYNPAVYGHLALDQLQLSGPQVPIELTSANLLASFNGFQASLNSRWQTPEGQLDWSAQANWLQPSQWFVNMAVVGDKLHTQLQDSELVISPNLRLSASPRSGEISGHIRVPAGHIRFNSLPESATSVSADEVIVAANQNTAGAAKWRLNSDIRLQIDDAVRLSAFGLDSRLYGNLRIRQQDLLPTLHGQVQLKDGQFRAYGQDFKLRKGKLTFNGPANQPLLAIEAIRNPEKTEDEVIAGLRVNGLADDPVVQVFSEPARPQANALAYLLLGRDIGSSAGDGAVTTGLIGIGIANTGKLVGSIGEAFGISDLSLDTAGSGDKSKVTVSGYLSPRLQVKYGVGIFSQFGEFTLRYRLMKQLYVEAVQGLATSVDVLYKMEFD